MAYRILTAAALLVALAAPAFAAETTIKRSTTCYAGNCSTETKIDRPEPSKPNLGYLPNFGTGDRGGAAPHSETLVFPAARAPEGIDPKCLKLNACLKIYPGREGDHGTVSFRSGNP